MLKETYEEIKKKLLEGRMDSKEWEALEKAEREQVLTGALADAISTETKQTETRKEGRLAAGALFPPGNKPPEGSEVLLPKGYVLAQEGVFKTMINISKKTNTIKAEILRLSRTPFFIAAKDLGSGRVHLLVYTQGKWRGEWVQASRLTINKLFDWLIFPDEGVKEKDLVSYARACAAEAPLAVSQDLVSQAAVEILTKLFPVRAAGVDFPALRAFSQVRELAQELGVDPLTVRKWWERQGFIVEGPGKVVRQGSGTARMLVFTERVKEFLTSLPEEETRREGKLFRIRFLSGPATGQEKYIALPGAPVVPLGAETPSPLSSLACALTGKHHPGEVITVKPGVQIQILEIDPPLQEQKEKEEAQAT